MKLTDKRTKIIATIGPASENRETLTRLFEAGMTTIRLNFSHGDYEEHVGRMNTVKAMRKEMGLPLSILLDTKGPEIRVGKFKGGKQPFQTGEKVTIYTDADSYKNKECGKGEMTVAYDMSKDIQAGKVILVDDGKLQLVADSVEPGVIIATTKNHHLVKTNKRVNLPGTKFSMPFLSEKDRKDIRYGVSQNIDFIAASFVNTPEDILEIKEILKEENASHIQIIAKIESQYAVDHFDEILEVTDGVMVARGDLGLEIPYYEVPVAEKMMIRKCRNAGKPVIVATQMLDSMESNPIPTRAEVTDVYFATELGADATMLSGETALGEFPVTATQTMATINKRAEQEFFNKLFYAEQLKNIKAISSGKRSEIAEAVANKVIDGDYKFAVVLSRTGELLKEVAKWRPRTAIIGVTNDEKQIFQFGVTAGVFMDMDVTNFQDLKSSQSDASKIVQRFGGVSGDKFIVVENHQITEFTI